MIRTPIKIEKAIKSNCKFIEWKIHNVCNHNCSFCGLENKDGSQRWLSLAEYKQYTDKIVESCNGDPFWLQITGGEPTLFPELVELICYIKSKGGYTSLISNGTRTLRWWEELKESTSLDHLYITYHSEQTNDYQHIAEVLNIFHNEPTETICLITHVVTSIDLAFEAGKFIKENTGASTIIKAMSTPGIYERYSADQLIKLKQSNNLFGYLKKSKRKNNVPIKDAIDTTLLISYDDGSTKIETPQALMKKQENYFLGWQCDTGRDFMRIDYVDKIYRGVCGVGGSSTEIKFTDDFMICDRKKCFCSTDLISTKIK
jgi:MoaA/NifB/PqqE/SkfB family radical SAM enzyme